MKTKERRERLQNKGFTLIELIVTIAIIAIFSGVVLTFISTGSNIYRSTSSSAKVQMETQETFDQIEDLIIDVNRSLYYANGSGDSLGAEIKNDIKQSGGAKSTGDKTFIICNEYKNGTGNSQYICDVLDWDKDDATIYYSQKEYKAASSSAGNETSVESLMAAEDDTEEENAVDAGASESETKAKDLKMKVDRSVLATGILDFRADVSKVESDKIVRFQLSTQNGTKEIETLHSVSLRNTVEVKKPADSYDDAPSTSVGIKIINAPSSVDPGNSYTLDYNLTGNGKIDPTTIKWEVTANTENGSFPTADPTYGKLTLSDTASGTITVIVSARTVDGDMITSAPVTIPINGKNATPESFTLSTNSILVAADGLYDLSTIIKGTLLYSDNTTADVKNPIAWSIKNPCTRVSLNGSQLTVTDEAGKDSANGSVTLTATEKDSGANKSADLEVRIARIDLTQPVGTYKVGDAKPAGRYTYTYMEAGAVAQSRPSATNFTVSIKKTDGTGDYIGGADSFTADDVGEWTARISYDLSGRGYGTVKDTQTFRVEDEGNSPITINNNKSINAVAAGQTYQCEPNINWGFGFDPKKKDSLWKVRWYLKDTYQGVSITNTTNNKASLTVQAATKDFIPHGFIIGLEYTKYNKWEESSGIAQHYYVEKSVNVVYGLELIEDKQPIYGGGTYAMGVNMLAARPDGSTYKKSLTENDVKNNFWSNAKYDSKTGKWLYESQPVGAETKVLVEFKIYGISGVFYDDKSDNATKKSTYISTEVTMLPTYSITAIDADTGEEIKQLGTSKKIKFEVHAHYKGQKADYTVKWNDVQGCKSSTEEDQSIICTPNTTTDKIYCGGNVIIKTESGNITKSFNLTLNNTFSFWVG